MNKIKSFLKKLFLKVFQLDLIKRPIDDIDYRNQRMILALSFFKLKVLSYEHKQQCDFINYCRINAIDSYSQNFQDLFVLYYLNEKKSGFFIEFGATNGIDLSNTLLLESKYSWNGILAEPAKSFHSDLRRNRGVIIDNRCVWNKSGSKIKFTEFVGTGLSGIKSNLFNKSNDKLQQYEVETVNLTDLLIEKNAPNSIDFLSIDTEGTEFEILQNFDFTKFQIKIIIVEHNYKSVRNKLFSLLTDKGYTRVFKNLSFQDDWYVLNN